MAETLPADPPKKKYRWLLPVLLLSLAAFLGTAWWTWQQFRAPQAHAPEPPAPPVFMSLEPFTVNLQPGGPQRHLHVAISVRVQDAAAQALLTEYLPEVRSRVLAVLSNREGPALMQPAAHDALAAEVQAALKRPFAPQQPGAQVVSVMFTTFLLQ